MTVVPVLIVRVPGSNAKFLMVIAPDPPVDAGVVTAGVVTIVVVAAAVVGTVVVTTGVIDAGAVGVGVTAGLC